MGKNGRKKEMTAEREILREYPQRRQGHQTMKVKRKQELKGKDHDGDKNKARFGYLLR